MDKLCLNTIQDCLVSVTLIGESPHPFKLNRETSLSTFYLHIFAFQTQKCKNLVLSTGSSLTPPTSWNVNR